ncbi:MAG: glutaredoxin family protein, partial [Gammaproteobacteria bacterium]|nr:glutaredoxin family protein [Gammaproteobacteria bacterium]
CHLCDELLEDLEALGRGIDLDIIDVDSDPALVSRYGDRVPVP